MHKISKYGQEYKLKVKNDGDATTSLTLRSWVSIPGRIIIADTKVPSSKKKLKTSRVTVELLEEGQQLHSRHGAEPHKQEACKIGEDTKWKHF